MTKANLSMCFIFRDDPLLEQAVASVRPYCRQICIVVDYDAPTASLARVEKLADVHVSAEWVDDFSHTRNRCLALATEPWVGWMDTDDIVVGAEHFAREIEVAKLHAGLHAGRLLGPYDYAFEDVPGGGRVVTQQQWRERIVPNDTSWAWEHPTHETLVKKNGHKIDPATDYWMRDVRWVHQRTEAGARGRSLEILRRWHAAGHCDAWTNLNLGVELHAANQFHEALIHYAEHFESSEWAEERVFSALRAADCALALDIAGARKFREAEIWISHALKIAPDAFEPRYAAAKLEMMRAAILGVPGAYGAAIAQSALALAAPETRTPIGRNLQDRAYGVHDLMRSAAEAEENWEIALVATERALLARPGDPYLTLARRRYGAAKLAASFAPNVEQASRAGDDRHKVGGVEEAAEKPLDVVFMCGPSHEPWNPDLVARYGAGGSETAVVEMARLLAGIGHRVRVYGAPGQEGTFDRVDYMAWTPDILPRCDVLVAWRMAALLPQGDAKVRLMWCHDVEAIGMTYGLSLLADRFLALSRWHADHLIARHGIPESQVYVTRNGIDPAPFALGAPKYRRPEGAVYTSSPDRGLGVLLDMWPAIRDRVPGATLDVCYGFAAWSRQADERKDEQHRFLVSTLKRRMVELEGVTYHGRLNKRELVGLLQRSGAWLYPTWWTETSCIAAMEARAAGLRIVTSPIAALPETVGPYGTMVEGDWLSDDYARRFIDASVVALQDRQYFTPREKVAEVAIRDLGWAAVAQQWSALFHELMAGAAQGALPGYREHREVGQ